jgi:FMN phosphatase YigB (HAD superfamily)
MTRMENVEVAFTAGDSDEMSLLLDARTLFDPIYYSTRYMGREASQEEAAEHFLRYGAYDERNPSRNFSTRAYLEGNPDVALGWNRPPLMHYLVHGRNEGRPVYPLEPAIETDSATLSALSATAAEERVAPRIAVVIHAFYPDYNADFSLLLSGWHHSFDLFITGPHAEVVEDLERRAKAVPAVGSIKTAITPNRGRNFGPFLVEFGAELATYDLIGHVHTKKSLYTGQARRDWAFHNISAVLCSPEQLDAVVVQLYSHSSAGLFHAERHWSLPFWAQHWLRNWSCGASLARELDIAITPGFVDYPVGGMFWARKEVLAPILAKQWRYEDFPEESGQTDGTTHHALERLIGAACSSAGFAAVQWSAAKASSRSASGAGQELFKTVSKRSVLDSIASADVVSFDIFDTLVYRNAKTPEDVRDGMQHRLPNYREIRAAAEHAVRTTLGPGEDVGMPHIAGQLQRMLGCSLEHALGLLNDELDMDLASLRPRWPVIQLVHDAMRMGKRVIFVSDMYYGEHELKAVLRRAKVPMPHKLYVSSGCGFRKDRGDLWPWLRRSEHGRIFHIGDNMVSDVQNASDHGVDSMYVPSIMEKAHMLGIFQREPTKAEWPVVFPLVEHFGLEPFFC